MSKKKLENVPILLDPAIKLYVYYLRSQGILEKANTSNELKFDSLNQNSLEVPFIKGIVNSKPIRKGEHVSSDDS